MLSNGHVGGEVLTNLLNGLTFNAGFNADLILGASDITTSLNTQFSGPITLNKSVNTETFTLQAGSTGGTTFTGKISGDGGLKITSPFGPGRRVILATPAGQFNTFSGDITIDDGHRATSAGRSRTRTDRSRWRRSVPADDLEVMSLVTPIP